MTSKILSIKTTSAMFLATVLIAGTIAAISPSFITETAQAQAYYDDRMDNKYNIYGLTDYQDDKKKYDSYGYSDYEMDSSYDDRKSYGMDDSYGYSDYEKDNYYESQYQPSYKSDYYEPKYQSYGKDDKDKSQKDSTIINKINCINSNNINVNGDFNGNITTFAASSGLAAVKGDLSAGSYSGNSGERYYDGYSKQDKGFECIINNNNNNVVVAGAGGGNITDGGNQTCSECFTTILSEQEIENLVGEILNDIVIIDSIRDLCNFIEGQVQTPEERATVSMFLVNYGGRAGISLDKIEAILDCLEEVFGVDFPRPN